jgi:hypothetical protein
LSRAGLAGPRPRKSAIEYFTGVEVLSHERAV